ncbi:cytosolic 5'-nucleotidase 3-like [Uloborus diversus]|uniref:cytosolic 5'-nucleotidase 3-like n=1 Tax=Uloborus diversus TaxID=327109 RepID=UPI0024097684|nr:cytosolic 5'-nucleotidase 3-like [Uloborus diversus]
MFSDIFRSRIIETTIGIGTVVFVSVLTFQFLKKPRKISRIIDTMEALKKSNVHIKNRDHVEEVVSQFIKDGPSKLQVISDFDHTLTRIHLNGKQCTTTYGILDQGPFCTDEFKEKSKSLFNHYHPIEVDPNLSRAEKVPYMLEWYTKSVLLMPTSGISKSSVPEMVETSNVCLRDGCDAVFELLHKKNVPLLIFSAGVGDMLKQVLQKKNLLLPNIKIIANFLRFDEKDKLLGFKDELIHTFNKNKGSIKNSDYFETLKTRNNVILLGDSLGDLDMAAGVQNLNSILKIGFLNYKIEESLQEYMDNFDIVLTDDQTMDVAFVLLQSIL